METQPIHGAQEGLPCVQDVYTEKINNIAQARGKEWNTRAEWVLTKGILNLVKERSLDRDKP